MATVSAQLPRDRIIHWDDPGALEAGRTMGGRDLLDAVLRVSA
jgi:hypothetical protein